ncbi:MAG: hypothetical protein P8Q26_12320 [Ascidiaceihabitans sp.]|nr:hypothetical protein [Ascidiaceihabitans sp.]
MLPNSFAASGFHARPVLHDIARFHVLGERSSGTNFVKRLLGRNTALKPTEALGWKHAFMHMRAVPVDLAVVCVVRSADSWVRSMHAKPWHTTPDLQKLDFEDFIRAEWDTIIDRPRYFDDLDRRTLGQPLQYDRDPITGKRFENIFALRTAKLRSLISMLNRDCACVLLRMEGATAAPEDTLVHLRTSLGLELSTDEFRPVIKRLGSNFKAAIDERPETPDALSATDIAHMKAHLDLDLEAQLGYSY